MTRSPPASDFGGRRAAAVRIQGPERRRRHRRPCAPEKGAAAPATSSTATSTTRIIASCPASSARLRARNATTTAFEFTVDEIVGKAREASNRHHGIAHRRRTPSSLPFSYYTDMLKALRALDRRRGLPRGQDEPQLAPAGVTEMLYRHRNSPSRMAGKENRRGNAARIEGGRPRFPDRRRRGNLPEGSPLLHRPG